MTTLLVSPHLDDALLSAPGYALSRRRAGERVMVLTVFSEGDESYAARRAEDVLAARALDVEPVHLGLLDAPFRRGLPRTFRALVLSPLALPDDDAARAREAIRGFARELGAGEVLLPLGVGEHIDHRIVHGAHEEMTGRIGFYEDRPYAMVRHAVRARLAVLGSLGASEPAFIPCPAAADELRAAAEAAPYIRAYLPDPEEQRACLDALADPLRWPARETGARLRPEDLSFDASIARDVVSAIGHYRSQLGDLFGDGDEEIRRRLVAAGERYTERIWWR